MQRIAVVLAVCVPLCAVEVSGQIITFSSPAAWVTQRNDSITIRAQIDTGQIKKREFVAAVEIVNDQLKKTLVAKKTFKITDFSAEFALGPIKQDLVGARSYVKIDWSIPGTQNKGTLSPLGIVALDKLQKPDAVTVPRIKDGASIDEVASSIKDADFHALGSARFALVWNKNSLFIVIGKQQAPLTLRFAFDGKNGKNAFLSFSDRVVHYAQDKDSVFGLHYARQMAGDTLTYSEKPWPNELKKGLSGDKIVISVPWFDTGIVPFEERKIGIGAMAFDAKGIQVAALPETAKFFLPGTWVDFLLAK